MTILNDKLINRFWSKVDIRGPNECWEWKESRNRSGYGRYRVGTERIAASRYALKTKVGDFDDALQACHTCDNPPCCNPHHRYAGTASENQKDAYDRGHRMIRVPPSLGEENANATLSEEDVKSIANLIVGGMNNREIADIYGVTDSAISLIRIKKNWTHLKEVMDLPKFWYGKVIS